VLREQWGLPKFGRDGPALVSEGTFRRHRVSLFKPQTFMNRSGEAVTALRRATSLDPTVDLLVLVDDLALPRGTFRLRSMGSAGGHNGLASVEQALGTQQYARLRIGIGPPPDDIDDQAEFVTAPFEPEELSEFAELLPSLVDAVECWVVDGIVTAMNRFNRRIGTEGEDREDGQDVR